MASEDAVYPPLLNKEVENFRPLADFPKSIWGDRFHSFDFDKQAYNMHAKEIGTLKEEVRSLLNEKQRKTIEKLHLIDTLEQLGISYHFEKEIDELLKEIFCVNEDFEPYLQNDLYATSLFFRLLRQHDFEISPGVFNPFLKDNGEEFKDTLSSDIRGLLSLYQAAHVRIHEDSILEEALSFTTTHLRAFSCGGSGGALVEQVNHALEQAMHKGLPRIEARYYISIYEDDEAKNPLLLRLAKLDYKVLQMLYRQELDEILRWGEHLETVTKVPYSRDRLVEDHFMAVVCLFEPQYSLGRIIFAKTVAVMTLVDDTYDSYGTVEELRAFTDAVERWDMEEIERLPEYMKIIYAALLNLAEWFKEELTKQGRQYASSSYIEEWKQYVRASFKQSCWFLPGKLPPFPVYEENGLITSGYYLLIAISISARESGTIEALHWLKQSPKIVVASTKITRFINDIGSYEVEKKTGAKTGLDCYMEHYNVSEEDAMEQLEQICEDAWKDINEELLTRRKAAEAIVPRDILIGILNLTRVMDVFYKHHQDAFTNPHLVIAHHIIAVLLDLVNV